jgi:death-on-curing protein
MNEPEWLLIEAVRSVHQTLIADHGGIPDLRDAGLLESALARPLNKFAYDAGVTIPELAAAYAFGLARNHAFVDGNKRIAISAAAMFLKINGFDFQPDRADLLTIVTKLAAGEIGEEELAGWIGLNSNARS